MALGLGQMALARAAGAHDEHRRLLLQVAADGQVVDQGAFELGQSLEVELLQGPVGAELRAPQPQAELLLLAPGNFVLTSMARNSVYASLPSMAGGCGPSESRMPESRGSMQ